MSKTSILSIACVVVALGCADTVPPELVDARAAYARAKEGPAAQHNPAELHTAQTALHKAEIAFEDEGDSFKARDRAYIAMRKARTAETNARAKESEQRAAKIRQETEQLEGAALARLGTSLRDQTQAVAAERDGREAAEQRAKQALQELSRVAQVGETERGMVITLPGGILFASGKSTLLPTAKAKLSEVGQALKMDPNAKMEVEGHTDARGGEKFNQRLSEQRAQKVRDYLVSQGIPADHITSKGLGESTPIANNESPEGRANNRRVEIVVRSSEGASQPGAAAPSAKQGA